ncbi:MAG: hypothetical protein QXO68_05690, partial [Conexivisphaerales archaeon]
MTVPEENMIKPLSYLGVDRNATGHIAVVANPNTSKVLKLGKEAEHIHKEYKKKGKYRKVKEIKN